MRLWLLASRLAITLAPIAPLCTSCGEAPSVEYRVQFIATGGQPYLQVEATWPRAPSNLELRAGADEATLSIGSFAASDGERKLPVAELYDTVHTASRYILIPKYRISNPQGAKVIVTYQVSKARREGDEHIGYTSRTFGSIDPEWCLLSGRQLFLVPSGDQSIGQASLSFELPAGWSSVTAHGAGATRNGRTRGLSLAALLDAPVALGPLVELRDTVDNIEVVFVVPSVARHLLRASDTGEMREVIRWAHELLGRSLPSPYVVVAVPVTAEGDDVVGSVAADGQGATLLPLTNARLQSFALGVFDALIRRHADVARVARRDFWLVDGVKHLYSWRALAHARRCTNEDLENYLEGRYVQAIASARIHRDMEDLYSPAEPGLKRLEREIIAPAVADYLDHELRLASAGATNLDSLLAFIFSARSPRSVWKMLSRHGSVDWDSIRANYVRGKRPLPLRSNSALQLTRLPIAKEPNSRATTETVIAYSGKSYSYLETCGCTSTQAGGLARRATVLDSIRRKSPRMVAIDAGSAFHNPERTLTSDMLTLAEERQYMKLLRQIGYRAIPIGWTEVLAGPRRVQEVMSSAQGLRLHSANVRAREVRPERFVLQADPVPIVLISIFVPPRVGLSSRAELALTDWDVADPITSLGDALDTIEESDALVVLMGNIPPRLIREIVRTEPRVAVILSTEDDAPGIHLTNWTPESGRDPNKDRSGAIDSTFVLYARHGQYGIGIAHLQRGSRGRIASAHLQDRWLDPAITDDRRVRGALTAFYREIGRSEGALSSVRPVYADRASWLDGVYVGAEDCSSCHEAESRQWRATRHADAYKSLLRVHRHIQPKCVSCHVVAFGSRHGYEFGSSSERLVGVQCESCHGPGREHVDAPSSTNISRKPEPGFCLRCHDEEHSPGFQEWSAMASVRH